MFFLVAVDDREMIWKIDIAMALFFWLFVDKDLHPIPFNTCDGSELQKNKHQLSNAKNPGGLGIEGMKNYWVTSTSVCAEYRNPLQGSIYGVFAYTPED